jgi:hypothetical protein
MSLRRSDLLTRVSTALTRDWRQGQREQVATAEPPKESTMTNFISSATVAIVITAYGFTVMSMFGAIVAGALGA